jgi:diguanylate cyclase (GGDEF)-like protein
MKSLLKIFTYVPTPFERVGWPPVLFFGSAILTWPVLMALEPLEWFYQYSRAHEDWELDELAALIVNLIAALIASAYLQGRRLQQALAEREAARESADRSARHDPLTGLANRRAFQEQLTALERLGHARAPRVIAVLDLDRFKPVNDLHGHAAGDAALNEVAQRVAEQAGEQAFVARLGGDEFAVLFAQDVDPDLAERYARRFITAVEAPIQRDAVSLRLGCSIGLTLLGSEDAATDGLSRADKALYLAKQSGRGRFAWYDFDLDQRSTERARLEYDLRNAIRSGEVTPHFQPVFEIETRKLRGFEVLARWTHPERGEVPPGIFIEIAEDTGLIAELGWSILRKACAAARNWDHNLWIAVNVSPHQFHDRALVEIVGGILADTGFAASRLEIEITESAVIRDFETARHTIDALRALGISMALDDFGTGYSSLSSLRRLPFDRLKIDRSFVTNISHEPSNQKIVAGIMALANGLQLDVTAEGIESDDDLRFMTTLNCSLGQGFLFERALPAQMIEWLLETRWAQGAAVADVAANSWADHFADDDARKAG